MPSAVAQQGPCYLARPDRPAAGGPQADLRRQAAHLRGQRRLGRRSARRQVQPSSISRAPELLALLHPWKAQDRRRRGCADRPAKAAWLLGRIRRRDQERRVGLLKRDLPSPPGRALPACPTPGGFDLDNDNFDPAVVDTCQLRRHDREDVLRRRRVPSGSSNALTPRAGNTLNPSTPTMPCCSAPAKRRSFSDDSRGAHPART